MYVPCPAGSGSTAEDRSFAEVRALFMQPVVPFEQLAVAKDDSLRLDIITSAAFDQEFVFHSGVGGLGRGEGNFWPGSQPGLSWQRTQQAPCASREHLRQLP